MVFMLLKEHKYNTQTPPPSAVPLFISASDQALILSLGCQWEKW